DLFIGQMLRFPKAERKVKPQSVSIFGVSAGLGFHDHAISYLTDQEYDKDAHFHHSLQCSIESYSQPIRQNKCTQIGKEGVKFSVHLMLYR
ncbi:hypothetical protein PSZ81_23870, partial [Shigella sonnei]|nr:hypothetical protein [Shigella sonnei]